MKFETIEAYSLPERIEAITKYLVFILSVNSIEGCLLYTSDAADE